MEKSPCFDTNRLSEICSKGRFADITEAFRALDHFAQPCRHCWRYLATLGDLEIDLEALKRHAAENLHEPPVALALGRLALVARRPAASAALAPIHRYLLRETSWNRSFNFWWLLIEEARLLALGSIAQQIERWQTFNDVLADDALTLSRGSLGLAVELRLLILAYLADDIRCSGQPRAAETLLADILPQADRCRPEIGAKIYEIQADLARCGLREPARALEHLTVSEALLKDVRIPGRRAETMARIAMARLLQNDLEPAFARFAEALEAIPHGTDPRLRNEILLHMAAIQMRLKDFSQVRRYLEQAEPFLECHASRLMPFQKDWLWSHVYEAEDQVGLAEGYLVKALRGFFEFGMDPIQILVELFQFYRRTQNPPPDQRFVDFIADLPKTARNLICEVTVGVGERRACQLETVH